MALMVTQKQEDSVGKKAILLLFETAYPKYTF